jgi:hypothetical protein
MFFSWGWTPWLRHLTAEALVQCHTGPCGVYGTGPCVWQKHCTCFWQYHCICVWQYHCTCVWHCHCTCFWQNHCTCVWQYHCTNAPYSCCIHLSPMLYNLSNWQRH